MDETSDILPEPANLKLLRRLVTLLLVVMIVGFLTLIVLFVMRFSQPATQTSNASWPSALTAPAGEKIIGLSKTPEFYAIITDQNQILIYDLDYNLVQTLPVIVEK